MITVQHQQNLKLFEIKSKLNKTIRTTQIYWQKIITHKHPSIKNKEKEVQKTISNPEIIKVSKTDKKVVLYYRKYNNAYLCVVVKHENGKGFIITTYLTKKIKEGTIIWPKQKKLNQ